MIKLETERLILREPALTDAQDMFEYAQSPEVGPRAGWTPHKDIDESKRILNMFIENNADPEKKTSELVIELKETGKMIGTLGLHGNNRLRGDIPGQIEIGYVLSPDYWGRGIMPEAVAAALDYCFDVLKMQTVTIGHYDYNDQSRRVIEKSGFKYEGTLRHAIKHVIDGSIYNLCCYSLTRREYLILKAEKLGLKLSKPEEISKDEYLAYFNEEVETLKAANDFNGRITPAAAGLKNGESFEEWRQARIDFRTSAPEGFVTDDTFFLTNESDRILGAANIRHTLNDYLSVIGGHIGYGIRPSERANGYATVQLALALEKVREIMPDVEKVLVTCNDTNPASAKTIEACGGVMENKIQEDDGNWVRRYLIRAIDSR